VSQWLSLGRNMQVLVADTLYEVAE
jgi:hypothetical protein